jgi:hypothetical protein
MMWIAGRARSMSFGYVGAVASFLVFAIPARAAKHQPILKAVGGYVDWWRLAIVVFIPCPAVASNDHNIVAPGSQILSVIGAAV